MAELSQRKKALFSAIVDTYVTSAKPVGSKMLAEAPEFDVSPATIRNEMKELEELGFITHPHTSAGRIPTAKGYRYYVENFVSKETALAKPAADKLETMITAHAEYEIKVKTLAKGIAEISMQAVLVKLDKNNFYYTGISNIFRQPEFANAEMMYGLSELIDHFDDVLGAIEIEKAVDILIGDNNPISNLCSTVATSYDKQEAQGVIAILGPIRMDYQQNLELVKHAKNILSN